MVFSKHFFAASKENFSYSSIPISKFISYSFGLRLAALFRLSIALPVSPFEVYALLNIRKFIADLGIYFVALV